MANGFENSLISLEEMGGVNGRHATHMDAGVSEGQTNNHQELSGTVEH